LLSSCIGDFEHWLPPLGDRLTIRAYTYLNCKRHET
jgi:hypothetical protein